MKKIVLSQLPLPVEQALSERLTPFCRVRVGSDMDDADLVITDAIAPLHPRAGLPVLALSFTRPLRLGSILRQIGQVLAQPALYAPDMALGDYTFRPQEKALVRGDDEIALTDREVDILVYLARRRGAPVSRDTLLKDVWQYQEGVDTHTLETHIYRLRQKIEASAEDPRILVTVDGGYSLQGAGDAV